jgi:hypothetical protein
MPSATAAQRAAMGNSYAALDAANLARSNAAAAARWEAMGNSYAAGATHITDSFSARLRGNGRAYAAQQAAKAARRDAMGATGHGQ